MNNNNLYGNYGSYYYGNYGYPTTNPVQTPITPYQQPVQQVRPSNKILVTGLDDALSRNVPLNSEFVYFHQDLDILYIVQTDATGKKTYLTLDIKPHEEEPPVQYVSKGEFDALVEQVKKLNGGATSAELDK